MKIDVKYLFPLFILTFANISCKRQEIKEVNEIVFGLRLGDTKSIVNKQIDSLILCKRIEIDPCPIPFDTIIRTEYTFKFPVINGVSQGHFRLERINKPKDAHESFILEEDNYYNNRFYRFKVSLYYTKQTDWIVDEVIKIYDLKYKDFDRRNEDGLTWEKGNLTINMKHSFDKHGGSIDIEYVDTYLKSLKKKMDNENYDKWKDSNEIKQQRTLDSLSKGV